MQGGDRENGKGAEWSIHLVGNCAAIERLDSCILYTGSAVALEQLANVQHLGAVLDSLRVATKLVAHQRSVRSELFVVLTHVDTVTVQVQRLLELPLLECSVAFNLQLVSSGPAFASVLRSLVAAALLLKCKQERRPGDTHIFLHRLELWGFRRGWRRQLLVLVVAVIKVVPLLIMRKNDGKERAVIVRCDKSPCHSAQQCVRNECTA